MIDFFIGFILDAAVVWGVEVANNCKFTRKVRIGWLIFVTLVYIALVGYSIWLVITLDKILWKVLSAALVLFLVGMFVQLWRKVLKAKEKNNERV